MNLHQSVCQLLKEIGSGRMLSTAYDTAWIARLDELEEPIGEEALDWLRSNQLADGSWGTPTPKYYHDRLICTLAAMTALNKARVQRPQDRWRWERARFALENASKGLKADLSGNTIGFEMIAPTLLREAQRMGLFRRLDGILDHLNGYRQAKLNTLPCGIVNRFVTHSFSAEMAGPDGLHLLDVDNLQESNGSIAYSPSATAYFALNVRRRDPAALRYLRGVVDGGTAPNVAPFDVFERAWTLWNLQLVSPLDDELLALCEPHLQFLEDVWEPGRGAAFASPYNPKDADDTSMAFEVLGRGGRYVDVDAILLYEKDDHFCCYNDEANPSTSINIHVLSALRLAGFDAVHPAAAKILRFLWRTQVLKLFWVDKWHASPYYPTAHAIIACAGYANWLVDDAVYWILETQSPDGAWGYYAPTAEETAYCLQALVAWKRRGKKVPDDVLKRGGKWLVDHAEPPYPPMWIGKCLYCPELVVRSTVLSALILLEQEGKI